MKHTSIDEVAFCSEKGTYLFSTKSIMASLMPSPIYEKREEKKTILFIVLIQQPRALYKNLYNPSVHFVYLIFTIKVVKR